MDKGDKIKEGKESERKWSNGGRERGVRRRAIKVRGERRGKVGEGEEWGRREGESRRRERGVGGRGWKE